VEGESGFREPLIQFKGRALAKQPDRSKTISPP